MSFNDAEAADPKLCKFDLVASDTEREKAARKALAECFYYSSLSKSSSKAPRRFEDKANIRGIFLRFGCQAAKWKRDPFGTKHALIELQIFLCEKEGGRSEREIRRRADVKQALIAV